MEPASPTTTSQSPSQKTSSDSFEDAHQIDDPPNGLFVEEDHFSVHSDIDFLEDVDLRSVISFSSELLYSTELYLHSCVIVNRT